MHGRTILLIHSAGLEHIREEVILCITVRYCTYSIAARTRTVRIGSSTPNRPVGLDCEARLYCTYWLLSFSLTVQYSTVYSVLCKILEQSVSARGGRVKEGYVLYCTVQYVSLLTYGLNRGFREKIFE